MRVYYLGLYLIFLLVLTSCQVDASPEQRKNYHAAVAALKNNDIKQFDSLAAKLKNYILYPYVEYRRLSRNLKSAKKSQINAFLKKNNNTAIGEYLKKKWLSQLIKEKRFAVAATYSAPKHETVSRCHILYAKIQLGKDVKYSPHKDLWIYGKSRPDACDPLFKYWKKKSYLSADSYGQRAKLALDKGNIKLARKLAKQATANISHIVKLHEKRRKIIRKAKKYRAGVYDELAQLPKSVQNDEVRAWQARQLLHQKKWDKLVKDINKMPASQRADDQWQYWLARAYARIGKKDEARKAYRKLAKNSSYYGFLSADRLGKPYSICKKTRKVDTKAMYKKYPELKRAFELRKVGSDYFAGREWNTAFRRIGNNHDDKIKAATIAGKNNWHHRGIIELGKLKEFKYYDVRFPTTWQKIITKNAKKRGLSPEYVYGILRTESAMRPDAVSPVGARGLMQVMPQTAKQVAKKYKLDPPNPAKMIKPEYSIMLGTSYLHQMAQRWDNQLVLMSASYNAGPGNAKKWRKILSPTADIFIDTIPYNETRKYVSRVLNYTVMYNWRLGKKVRRLSGIMSNIGSSKGFLRKKNSTVNVICDK